MNLSVDIKKKLGEFELNIKVDTGRDVLALVGASGCGKSMTMKCIAGIERPDSGRIVLNGRVLFDSEKHIDLPPKERRVGYLFQQYALFPNMTVLQNVMAGVRKSSAGKAGNAEQTARAMLERFGISDIAGKHPHEISGGQQQRTALARIMVNEPDVLLLDEPLSALDPYLRYTLAMEMKEVLESFDKEIILVSHSMDEIEILAKNMIVINRGEIVREGSVDEVFEEPGSDYTANIIDPWHRKA
ncbi:MAG: ATP-binding cassette domain-containing protein [Eubacteriales bacterium]|nr:ATP-binding cassette domain-containing protein [Eubacteriales bacterium]